MDLSDATALRSAFANDSFGLNITENTSDIAADRGAIFAINGDYYGFRDTGIVIRNGVIYRDDGAREGLAFYRDGSVKLYDETATTAQELVDDGVWNTLSFGRPLSKMAPSSRVLTLLRWTPTSATTPSRESSHEPLVGVKADGTLVFVVVDGRSTGYSKGMTMTEAAELMVSLGCETAYNLGWRRLLDDVLQRRGGQLSGRNRQRARHLGHPLHRGSVMIVLIPSLEPDHRLPELVRLLRGELSGELPESSGLRGSREPRGKSSGVRILIVDDGSGPAYEGLRRGAAAGAVVIGYPTNRGKGFALRHGLSGASRTRRAKRWCAPTRTRQHTPADIARVAAESERHPQALVLGVRGFVGDVPLRSRFGNNMSALVSG